MTDTKVAPRLWRGLPGHHLDSVQGDPEERGLGRFLPCASHLEDVGAYPAGGTGSLGGLVMMLFTGPYRVGKTRFKNQAVYTNTMGRGPYRGPWMMESMAREGMVDIVARGIGMDPLDFRRRNVIHQSDLPYVTPGGMPLDIVSPEECLEQAAVTIGYDAFRQEQAAALKDGRLLGVGIGLYIEPSGFAGGTLGTEVAEVRIDVTGKVTVIMGQASHGQSLETTMVYAHVARQGVTGVASRTRNAAWKYGASRFKSRNWPALNRCSCSSQVTLKAKQWACKCGSAIPSTGAS